MAVTRLAFQLTDGSNYIDLAQQLSIHMRTMIRQKQVFTILGGMIVDNASATGGAKYAVSTVPNTWYVKAAINRAFKAWKFSRNKLLEESASDDATNLVTGKFADFKVFYNSGAYSLYKQAIVTAVNSGTGLRKTYTGSEWNYATLLSEAGAPGKEMQILGDHTESRYGMLKGWLQSREIPNHYAEPDMPDLDGDGAADVETDFLATLHGTQDAQSEKLDVLFDENDRSPFHTLTPLADLDDAHNSTLQALGYVSATNPQSMIPGFKALCGLVHIEVADSATNPILFLDVMNTPEGF